MPQTFSPESTTTLRRRLPPNACRRSMGPRSPLAANLSSLEGPFQVALTFEAPERIGMLSPHLLVPFKRTRQDKACHRVSQLVTLASTRCPLLPVFPRLPLRIHLHRVQASKPMRASACSSRSGSACRQVRTLPPILMG